MYACLKRCIIPLPKHGSKWATNISYGYNTLDSIVLERTCFLTKRHTHLSYATTLRITFVLKQISACNEVTTSTTCMLSFNLFSVTGSYRMCQCPGEDIPLTNLLKWHMSFRSFPKSQKLTLQNENDMCWKVRMSFY